MAEPMEREMTVAQTMVWVSQRKRSIQSKPMAKDVPMHPPIT